MLTQPGQHRVRVGVEVGEGHRLAEREGAAAGCGLGGPLLGLARHPADSSAATPAAGPDGPARRPPASRDAHHGIRPGIMLDMRLSARADYALRAAIELAATERDHITAEQLARAQNIPGKFLEAILTQLRRAGLVRSQRGPDGGFWLARPASDISLADIIRAIDGPLVGVRGERPEKVGYSGAAEPLQTVWIALRANERAILEEVTLEDIVTRHLPLRVRELAEDPRAWASGP
jgi:Rrf2 family protein